MKRLAESVFTFGIVFLILLACAATCGIWIGVAARAFEITAGAER